MNLLIHGIKKIQLKKRIHRFIVIICVVTLCFHVVTGTKVSVKAEPGIIAALGAALPISWPVVVAILVAGGVGTTAYYMSLSGAERELLIRGIKEKLVNDGKTMVEKYAGVANAGDYIVGAVHDGLMYVGEEYLNSIWDFCAENDMLGGNTAEATPVTVPNYSQWLNRSTGITSDNLIYNSDPISVINYTGFTNCGNDIQKSTVLSLLKSVGQNKIVIYRYSWFNSPTNLSVYEPSSILDQGLYFDGYDSNGIGIGSNTIRLYRPYLKSTGTNATGYNVGTSYTIGTDGSITTTAISVQQTSFLISSVLQQKDNGTFISNLGTWEITESGGVPVGEIGQVIQDAANNWVVPYAPGAAVDLDGYGVGYPVSVGDEVAAEFPLDIDTDIDWTLPDVIEVDVDDPISIPVDQADAQAGEYNPPKAIDPDAGEDIIYPGIDGFIPPSNITSKFPFCIPFDIKLFLSLFVASNTTAPHFVVPMNFSEFGSYTIDVDFSPYDSTAQLFRWLYLALFCIGIITKYDPFTTQL